jgi:hypothetical protein
LNLKYHHIGCASSKLYPHQKQLIIFEIKRFLYTWIIALAVLAGAIPAWQ